MSGENGIHVADSAGLQVEGNTVYDNRGNGIFVAEQDTDGALVRSNTVNHNGDDGIHSDSALLTITQNITEHNADFGIDAITGVTDGGGNKAVTNGNLAQCVGVVCI